MAGSAGQVGSTNATGSAARFSSPYGVAVDTAGNIYVSDSNNYTIRKVTSAGVVTTLAGTAGNVGSSLDGTGAAARFQRLDTLIAVDTAGNVYAADYSSIRKVTSAGIVSTLAGAAYTTGSTDATGSAARFNQPTGVAVDSEGNVFVADNYNHTIRKVTSSGVVTTLAGTAGSSGSTNGTGSAARFNRPYGITVDTAGNLFVTDRVNYTIRKVTSAGVVTTFAGSAGSNGSTDGTGSAARFSYPAGIAVDNAGNIFVADANNDRIRKITSAGVVTTEAGGVSSGSADGFGSDAFFNAPFGVAVDASGNVYVADRNNHTIRASLPAATVTLSGLTKTYTGSAQTPTTTVSPSGLTLQLTYTGTAASLSAPVTAGSYGVTASVVDNNYYGSTTGVITISKAAQTITFASIPTKIFGSGSFSVAPSSTSSLTVGISSSNTAVATVSGFSISPTGAGVTTISATQAGNTNYLAAATVTQILTVSSASATVTLSDLTKTYNGLGQVPSTTVSPLGLAIQLTYSGTAASLSAPVTAGAYAVTASVVDNNYYGSVGGVITISKAAQTITFASVPSKFVGSGPFTVAPSSTSNLTVALSSSNTAVATVSGFSISPIGAGTTTISATQAGDTNYLAAATVTQVLTATTAPIAQTIAFAALSPRRVASLKDVYSAASLIATSTSLSFTDATSVAQANARSNGSFALVATASSGLPVTFTSTVTAVASIVGNICTPVTPGVTSIVAAQAGSTAYSAASTVTQSLVIVEKQFAWLDLRWELTDLQIDARTRAVSSAKGNGAVLTIRQGDAHDIAVFFTDPAGAAILMAPSNLKLCIREKTNRRPVVLETTAFTPADFGGFDPYYQITFTADNDSLQRFVAFNGVADNSDAIPAIGEVEWTYGGKVYSSKPFTVNIVPEIEREISDV